MCISGLPVFLSAESNNKDRKKSNISTFFFHPPPPKVVGGVSEVMGDVEFLFYALPFIMDICGINMDYGHSDLQVTNHNGFVCMCFINESHR